MDYLKVVLMSIFSLIELFLLTKLIGNRQMSELNMFDYINGITIGSIAAEMATAIDEDVIAPAIAMVIYGVATAVISIAASKSVKARRIIEGRAVVLFKNGKFIRNSLKSTKIDISEILTQCRVNGFFDMSEVDSIILEANGKMSVMPKALYRPLVPNDVGMTPVPSHPMITIIEDGRLMDENLHKSGKDIQWVESQLKDSGISHIGDVFYAGYDFAGDSLSAFKKDDGEKEFFN